MEKAKSCYQIGFFVLLITPLLVVLMNSNLFQETAPTEILKETQETKEDLMKELSIYYETFCEEYNHIASITNIHVRDRNEMHKLKGESLLQEYDLYNCEPNFKKSYEYLESLLITCRSRNDAIVLYNLYYHELPFKDCDLVVTAYNGIVRG